ncbi:hypothetical protein P692DRAFT_20875652 [Suillus brevipes Sb2]|nr:hypothetical protein P692DRAFT_20875652 [Suillus brevipes Sb2]
MERRELYGRIQVEDNVTNPRLELLHLSSLQHGGNINVQSWLTTKASSGFSSHTISAICKSNCVEGPPPPTNKAHSPIKININACFVVLIIIVTSSADIFQCTTNTHTLTSAVDDRSAATNHCADASDTIPLTAPPPDSPPTQLLRPLFVTNIRLSCTTLPNSLFFLTCSCQSSRQQSKEARSGRGLPGGGEYVSFDISILMLKLPHFAPTHDLHRRTSTHLDALRTQPQLTPQFSRKPV